MNLSEESNTMELPSHILLLRCEKRQEKAYKREEKVYKEEKKAYKGGKAYKWRFQKSGKSG